MTLTLESSDAWYPTSAQEALRTGRTSYLSKPPPMPPVKVNGVWHSWEEVYGPLPPVVIQVPLPAQEAFLRSLKAENSTVLVAGAMAGPAYAKGPTKPPKKPVKGSPGKFGLAYFTFPNGQTNQPPNDGFGGSIRLEGVSGNASFIPVPDFKKMADGFAKAMSNKGWKSGFHKADSNLSEAELKDHVFYGGSNIFRQVEIGLFMSHGTYSFDLDWTVPNGPVIQSYFPLGGTNSPSHWIRLSEFNFTGNLRWMGLFACNGLQDEVYQDNWQAGSLPISDTLHLLCAGSTIIYAQPELGGLWAKKMLKGNTVPDAWMNSGIDAYRNTFPGAITNNVRFRVAGWDSCFGDRLQSYTDPDPGIDLISYREDLVWPR